MKTIVQMVVFALLATTAFSQTTYVFNGFGNWSTVSNWQGNLMPPSVLPAGSTIRISPSPDPNNSNSMTGICRLDLPQTISPGASLVISANAEFIVTGMLSVDSADISILICNQTWKQKNLDVVRYNNGDIIPEVSDSVAWQNLTTGAWCWYKNDYATYGATYGRLYNLYALNDPRGLAPAGWHLPNEGDWDALVECAGGYNNSMAVYGLKQAGSAYWQPGNGTNSTGFTALPGGCRCRTGAVWHFFSGVKQFGKWWVASENGIGGTIANMFELGGGSLYLYMSGTFATCGFSVRFVKNSVPIAKTGATTVFTVDTARVKAKITSNGGVPVTARGVVWGTNANPTLANNFTVNGTAIDTFTAIITGLAPNTTYHVRAYATNQLGTAYGADSVFTTPGVIGIPVVKTTQTLFVNAGSAVSGGEVVSNGAGTVTARGICWSTSPSPTIALATKTVNGSGLGTFMSDATNLNPSTTYYIRAYATNSAGTGYGADSVIVTNGVGANAPTVTICSQVWMRNNLDVVTFRNGDTIPQVTSGFMWSHPQATAAWCYYNNDPAMGSIYGKLYNLAAVTDPRGLAPVGWHIPSDAEWTTMTNCLGGLGPAGIATKEVGYAHWSADGVGGTQPSTNSSGLTLLPGGWRGGVGDFAEIKRHGMFWTSTVGPFGGGWMRRLMSISSAIERFEYNKVYGLSVRCVKD